MSTGEKTMDLDTMVIAYATTALWASTDDDGAPLDRSDADIAHETRATFRRDVSDFMSLIERECLDVSAIEAGQLGHDFWLTRNRHGAGFWDRGLGPLGNKLTELAHSMGEVNLVIGDDGLIYQC